MSSKTDRHEPCECGSGKKHKDCCGAPKSEVESNLNRQHCPSANQLADSSVDLFPTNLEGGIVVEFVFLAQLFQIVTLLAFFL